MGELVELDVTTVEESVTVNVTEEGQVQVAVFAEKGATGPAGPAGPNSVTSATTSDGTAELEVLLLTTAEGITANRGVNETSAIYADGGNGTAIYATSEADAVTIASDNGTALTVTSNTGNDIAVFRDASQNGINIENPRGWLTWVYEPGEIYLGRLKTADITDDREWTLPNASGTVALTDDPRFTDARTPLAHTHVVSDIVSIASQHLIGRHAGGTGAGQAVDVGNGLEFQGSGIRRSALTGDITASAGSNATTLAATIAGAKTFSGQLQLTGQAATDANSAMTRDLDEKNIMFNIGRLRLIPQANNIYTSASGGTATAGNNGFSLAGNTTANSYARAALTNQWTTYPGSTGASNNVNVPVAFALSGNTNGPNNANTVIRFVVGSASTGAPPLPSANAISGRGFGFEIFNDGAKKIRIFAHDGTTYTTSDSIAFTGSFNFHTTILIASDGLGNIKLFLTNTLVGQSAPPRVPASPALTHTGGPVGNNQYAADFASVLVANAASGTITAAFCTFQQVMIHIGAIY